VKTKRPKGTAAALCLAWLLAGAGALWSCWPCGIHPLNEGFDCLRYLGMAEAILRGEWLGSYDHMTLIRLPVYSLFLALNSWAGWRLHVAQQVFYLLSVLALGAALLRFGWRPWQLCLLCGLCALHPAAIYPHLFVATEAVHPALTTAVLAGCLGVLGSIRCAPLAFALWVAFLSGGLAAFWHTRPEAAWIVPVLGAACIFLFLGPRKTTPGPEKPALGKTYRRRVLLAIAAPCLATLALGWTLASLNHRHYGIKVTHEFAEPNFLRFGQWLTRLAPEARKPRVPVPREAFDAAYSVSPHAAMLEPALSWQTGGEGWSRHGCEMMGICDDIAGGWTAWAIRDAVNSIGKYANARAASAFYGAAADEIALACREGRTACSKNPTGNLLAPPLSPEDIPRLLTSFWKTAVQTLTLGDFRQGIEACGRTPQEQDLVARYRNITHDQAAGPPLQARLDVGLHCILFTWLQIGGTALAAVLGALAARRRPVSRYPAPVALALILLLSRTATVAYIDAMSYPGQIRYLLAVYPALMLLLCTSLRAFQRQEDPVERQGGTP